MTKCGRVSSHIRECTERYFCVLHSLRRLRIIAGVHQVHSDLTLTFLRFHVNSLSHDFCIVGGEDTCSITRSIELLVKGRIRVEERKQVLVLSSKKTSGGCLPLLNVILRYIELPNSVSSNGNLLYDIFFQKFLLFPLFITVTIESVFLTDGPVSSFLLKYCKLFGP